MNEPTKILKKKSIQPICKLFGQLCSVNAHFYCTGLCFLYEYIMAVVSLSLKLKEEGKEEEEKLQ